MHPDIKELAHRHNWTEWQTGGGCTALHRPRDLRTDSHCLITKTDSPETPDTAQEPCILSFFDGEAAEPQVSLKARNTEHAMQLASLEEIF
jgi:hypothetical protein